MTFPKRALGELIELHDNRRVPLSGAQRAKRKGSYPYYGAQGIIDWIDDFRYDGSFLLIPEDGENLRSRKLPIAFVAEGQFWVNNHAHVMSARPDEADQRFLKYAVESTDIGPWVTGAAQPKLSQEKLRIIDVPCPRIRIQVQVADVLTAFHELIESNRRRIEVLDEAARSLYTEWFLRYRFVGHESAKFINSPLGQIPEGWVVAGLGENLEFVMGQSPPSVHYNDDGLGLPFHQGVGSYGRRYPRHGRWTSQWTREASAGDILVSVRAPVGRLNIADRQMALGRGVAAVRPTDGLRGYWFEALRHVFRHEDAFGGGTIFKAVTRTDLSRIECLLPPADVRRDFDSRVRPVAELDQHLDEQVRALAAARDLLLPKLVTGKIEVDSLAVDDVFGWAELAEELTTAR